MRLRLENFDGPLDLLLHLIKAQEINIFNIPILLITEQYLSFLRQVPDLDFHVAGEYLAMAAQLIEIKAQYLVPVLQNKVIENPNSLADVPDDDPRKDLVKQLLAFDNIKLAVEMLANQKMLGRDVFASGEHKRREHEFTDDNAPIKGDAYELVIAFERVLLRFSESRAAPKVTVRAQKITIESKINQIKERFHFYPSATLLEFFELCETRYELIVTLMAVLELCKANQLEIDQTEPFGTIHVRPGTKFHENLILQSDGNSAPLAHPVPAHV